MTRWPLLVLLLIQAHTANQGLPVAEPIIVTRSAHYSVAEHRRNTTVRQEAKRWGVPYRIAYAVSHAEVYNADSTAVSSAGAVGIMQIHPGWFGAYDRDCYGPGDMTNLRRNACYGVLLLRRYYDQTESWPAALRLYLGYKKNTPALLAYLDDIIEHMVGLE